MDVGSAPHVPCSSARKKKNKERFLKGDAAGPNKSRSLFLEKQYDMESGPVGGEKPMEGETEVSTTRGIRGEGSVYGSACQKGDLVDLPSNGEINRKKN